MNLSLLVIISLICINKSEAKYKEKCFTAAVYEQVKLSNTNVEQEIIDSLAIYGHVVAKAAENGAKIIIFPEHGIYVPPYSRDETKPHLEMIPNQMNAIIPCDLPDEYRHSRILFKLSCLAKTYKIYVVSNMGEIQYCDNNTDPRCPPDERYHFNTAVVFDTTGTLIAKYRKFHLFNEHSMNYPKGQQLAYFDTPFGRFGLSICFDSIFKHPTVGLINKFNVTTLTLMEWWFNEMPFIYAHIFQQSLAISHNVNLLAANANEPYLRSSGSGIYNGANGAVVYTHDSTEKIAHLLIADLSVDASDKHSDCGNFSKIIPVKLEDLDIILLNEPPNEISAYTTEDLDFTLFKYINLSETQDTMHACHKDVCCSLNYSKTDEVTEFERDYVFWVGSQIRDLGRTAALWCEEFCAIAAFDWSNKKYSTDFGNSFDSIHLKATFTTPYVYPSLTTNNLELAPKSDWIYSRNENTAEIKTTSVFPIISAGFFARCFDKDPPFPPR